MKSSGYSLIEVFGVVALVLTLAVVAIPSIKSFTEGGKQGAAARNASALNSAVAQYDQSGGLITAKVTVPSNVASLPVNELPELKVLSLLREADGGSLVSAWQEPIFDDEGYRVVWRNDLPEDKKGVTSTLGGESNAAAEALIASGDGGRFELISPLEEAGRKGIIGFQQGGLLVAAIEPETEPSPTPVPANRNPAVVLTASNPSPKVGDLVAYYANGTDPDGDSLTYTFTHVDGTEPAGSSSTFSRAYTSTGTFSVSVNVTDGKGGTAQASIPVTVGAANAAPGVSLSVSAPEPFRNKPFTYTAAAADSNGDALTYRFIYNGSIAQEGPNPVYVTSYPSLGDKLVTVVAIDPTGLSNSTDITATVLNQAPAVGISVNPLTGYRGQVITFTASGTDRDGDAMTYSFDGGAFAGNTIQKTYPTVGNYTVSVRSNDGMNQANSISASVTGTVAIVNRMPSVSLVVDKSTGVRGEEFTFTATGTDPDNDAIAYSFKVGRTGTWSEYKEANEFKHTFANVGEMEVFAKVRDALGGESVESAPVKVTIVNRAPTVTVAVDKPTGYRGETFTFTASGSDPDGDSLVYSFNGGAFGASNVFRTSFSTVGNQTVSVVTRDALGASSAAASTLVNIANRAPTIVLQASPVNGRTGQAITFTSSASDPDGDSLVYSFNVDGSWTPFAASSTTATQYATPGAHSVQVVTKDALGATSNTATASVNIVPTVNLTVLASPATYGVPYGSGPFAQGGTATAQIAANYGYEFKGWQGGWGASNPMNVTMSGDMTLTGTLDRRLFAVSLYTSAGAGGGAGARGNYAAVHAYVYNATTGAHLGTYSSAAQNHGANATDADWHTIWVPYGDTVYFNGYAHVYSMHMGVSWTGGGYHQPEYGRWGWYGNWYNGVGAVQVLGDTSLGYFGIGTPLVVDMSGDGKIDLLAGHEWKKSAARRPTSDMSVYREFNLDGTGPKRWEWVGAKDGILVYMDGLNGTPGPENIFGTRTFGKDWKHGFEPLAELDKDGSGSLMGEELDAVGVWVDANSDAVVQPGEVRSAKDAGLTSLSTTFDLDGNGNTSNESGAELDGKPVTVWDWISYSYPETTKSTEVARLDWADTAPPTEYFNVTVGEGMEEIDMLPGGTLSVHRINDQLYIRATAAVDKDGKEVLDVLYPAEATKDGTLRWGVPGLANSLVASGPDFYGLTLEGSNRYAVWSAKLVSGDLSKVFGDLAR